MKAGKRIIGLHLRIQKVLPDVMQTAQKLGLVAFQSFVSINSSGKRLFVTKQHIQEFSNTIQKFDAVFFHGSYKINPSSCIISHHYILEREVKLVVKLGVPFLILHPGSAVGCSNEVGAIDALARTLNTMQKKYSSITFILENGAHGNPSIGCNIEDFAKILPKLDYPDRIKFCIDTAHAFCYGYDIRDEKIREAFIQLLEDTIGIQRIALLHINDTQEQLGSKHDQHEVLGKGVLGVDVLRAFALYPKLVHIPIILELPELSIQEYKDVITTVRAWHV